ncbi:MAG TPA: type II toxin-antitoxin system PemK/MazF family toxin, partial [Nitrospirota bacterium]|nr:type II toxin-antitoxin system PemK/MazF family toxin [Nitrospirota bacterium]
MRTLIAAPLTTAGPPIRAPCRFKGRAGSVAIDQIRTVDRERLVHRLGKL